MVSCTKHLCGRKPFKLPFEAIQGHHQLGSDCGSTFDELPVAYMCPQSGFLSAIQIWSLLIYGILFLLIYHLRVCANTFNLPSLHYSPKCFVIKVAWVMSKAVVKRIVHCSSPNVATYLDSSAITVQSAS